jgi:hypothetical protein
MCPYSFWHHCIVYYSAWGNFVSRLSPVPRNPQRDNRKYTGFRECVRYVSLLKSGMFTWSSQISCGLPKG